MNKTPSLFCSLCEKRECPKSCHFLDFRPIESKERIIFNPIMGCYVPRNSEQAATLLINLAPHLRPTQPSDQSRLRAKAVILTYQGNKPRKVFKGWGIYVVDFGSVGLSYAEVAIIKCLGYFAPMGGVAKPLTGPQRFAVASHTLYVVTSGTRPAGK